jgi:hypothetical protein
MLPWQRPRQEAALFEFFASAIATLDGLAWATYHAGSVLLPASFPLDAPSLRNVYFSTVAPKIAAVFPGTSLQAAFDSVANDPPLVTARGLRNVLTHRASPGRLIVRGSGPVPPDEWDLVDFGLAPMALTAATTSNTLTALEGWLSGLVPAIADWLS